MPQDYFAPTRQAMTGMTQNLMLAGQMRKQNAMQQARQQAFADPNRAAGMQAMGASGDIQGMNAMAALGGYEQKQTQQQQQQFDQTSQIAQRIKSAPAEMQSQLYDLANNEYFGGKLPQYDQGGRDLVDQYAAIGKQPQVKPYEGLAQGYETYLRANKLPSSPETYRDWQTNVLAQKKAAATKITIGGATPGRKKADEVFAKEYVDWNAAGGYADVEKQVGQLDEVIKSLESGRELTGPVTGSVPAFVQKFTNPEALAVKDAVEEVVQRNLRLVLGAQFTEREGIRLIARAYNPNLDEKENVKRVKRLIGQIKAAARAKESASRYWEQNGTLTGWTGKTYTMDDFMKVNPAVKSEAEPAAGGIKFLGFE